MGGSDQKANYEEQINKANSDSDFLPLLHWMASGLPTQKQQPQNSSLIPASPNWVLVAGAQNATHSPRAGSGRPDHCHSSLALTPRLAPPPFSSFAPAKPSLPRRPRRVPQLSPLTVEPVVPLQCPQKIGAKAEASDTATSSSARSLQRWLWKLPLRRLRVAEPPWQVAGRFLSLFSRERAIRRGEASRVLARTVLSAQEWAGYRGTRLLREWRPPVGSQPVGWRRGEEGAARPLLTDISVGQPRAWIPSG
uniref:uncharacterized protein LOC114672324 n=1 Tax=Macaca mulatta TaxID=9544 RepID=UPI0010A1FB99|nr:uncharacterized protein LOC114672324 [Macaca mulatta]